MNSMIAAAVPSGSRVQLSSSGSGDTQLVVVCGVAHVAGNRALSLSPVT